MMKGQIAALCLAFCALPVAAEGFYAFADLGTSDYELSADGSTDSDDDTALGLGAGYSFNSYIAAELAYRSFGSISDSADGVGRAGSRTLFSQFGEGASSACMADPGMI